MRRPLASLGHLVTALAVVACLAVGASASDSIADRLVLGASVAAGCALMLGVLRAGLDEAALLRPAWIASAALVLALVLDLPGPVDGIVFGLGAGAGLGLLAALALPGSVRQAV